MKVHIHTANMPTAKKANSLSSLWPRWSTLVIVAVTVVSTYAITINYLTGDPAERLWDWADERGHAALGDGTRLLKALTTIPQRLMQSADDIPKLVIDIKFKHIQKLREKRAKALENQLLVQSAGDFVPASIRQANRTIKVKLRLKGDHTDHLEGDKWSFRIHVKGKDHIFGMRRFSIQHPRVRGYQGEVLFFETLRDVGVLTPRYFFVAVVVNGTDIGIMALEEHFSKELLESNGYRDSPIVRFDESLYWAEIGSNEDLRNTVFGSFRNAPVDAFGSSRISNSERLSSEYALAVGLLRGFVNGELTASQTFDAERLGRFLAVAELWGSWHSIRWHNQRFVLNSLTAKLEPVGFDSDIQGRRRGGTLVVADEHLSHSMLDDPEIFAVYRQTLERLGKEIGEGALVDKWRAVEQRHLPALQKEFYLLQSFPYGDLKARAERLLAMDTAKLKEAPPPNLNYPAIIHVYLQETEQGSYLEVANAVIQQVEIHSVRWVDKDGNTGEAFQPSSGATYPIRLAGTPRGSLPQTQRIYFDPPEDVGRYDLVITTNVLGQTEHRTVIAKRYHPPLKEHPVPVSAVDEQLSQHSFLSVESGTDTLSIRSGTWQVKGWLVIPPGSGLTISAGTTLQFQSDGGLIAHGPLNFQGTDQGGVVLEGIPDENGEDTWQGIIVLKAGAPSRWSHVTVRNTTGIDWRGWQVTGGVTFYRSDLEMEQCLLQGHRGEDALNIVHSKFRLKDVTILDTASDGFDGDFADGTVEGGLFENIGRAGGGDGVDISGSVVKVVGTRFRNVSDKALSVGEGSVMTASDVVIQQVGTGAASKDRSRLVISESSVEQAQNAGLMAYIKKPEFGPAHIEANNVIFVGPAPEARAQKGSSVVINGNPVEGEDVDVAQLYGTIMRPGLRK